MLILYCCAIELIDNEIFIRYIRYKKKHIPQRMVKISEL